MGALLIPQFINGTVLTGPELNAAFAAVVQANAYQISGAVPFGPSAGSSILLYATPAPFTIPADFASSTGVARSPATSAATFTISHNGSIFGSMVFEAGATTPIFSSSPVMSFAPGDILEIVAPEIQDLTLANIGFTIFGQILSGYVPPPNPYPQTKPLYGTVRPTNPFIGQTFLDQNLGIPIECSSISPIIWINAAGVAV